MTSKHIKNTNSLSKEFGLYEKSFSYLLESLKSIQEIERAAIFGSRAMGNYKNSSDIDLAIFGSLVNRQTVSTLSQKLNDELPIPYFVDIVDYNNLESVELKEHIDLVGVEMYKRA